MGIPKYLEIIKKKKVMDISVMCVSMCFDSSGISVKMTLCVGSHAAMFRGSSRSARRKDCRLPRGPHGMPAMEPRQVWVLPRPVPPYVLRLGHSSGLLNGKDAPFRSVLRGHPLGFQTRGGEGPHTELEPSPGDGCVCVSLRMALRLPRRKGFHRVQTDLGARKGLVSQCAAPGPLRLRGK